MWAEVRKDEDTNVYWMSACGSALPQFNLPKNLSSWKLKSTFYRCEGGIRGVESCALLRSRKDSKGEGMGNGHLKFYTLRRQLLHSPCVPLNSTPSSVSSDLQTGFSLSLVLSTPIPVDLPFPGAWREPGWHPSYSITSLWPDILRRSLRVSVQHRCWKHGPWSHTACILHLNPSSAIDKLCGLG